MLHAKGAPQHPYDGHALGPVIACVEALTGVEVQRIHVNKVYRGQTLRTDLGSGSPARSAGSPRLSAGR